MGLGAAHDALVVALDIVHSAPCHRHRAAKHDVTHAREVSAGDGELTMDTHASTSFDGEPTYNCHKQASQCSNNGELAMHKQAT